MSSKLQQTKGSTAKGQNDETYSDGTGRIKFTEDGLETEVRLLSDGLVDIQVNERRPSIAGLLNYVQQTTLSSDVERKKSIHDTEVAREKAGQPFPINLNIVIQVIGSRGDIQPFVALGQELTAHHHRVRIATHPIFRDFVLEAGLEFFSIGGDPEQLMAFMVQNPSLIPGLSTIRSGAIQRRRREMREIIDGCWKSCFESGDGRPFVADAIIANPPSLAHIHCAQRLGIPLHIMFTMPWSPTQSFPHPLSITHPEHCKATTANFISYAIVDMMVWEGLGDIVNKFRRKSLSLDPLDRITAPSIIHRLQVPCAYLWSPSLFDKPPDWSSNIDICGFCFLPSKLDYKPPADLEAFLRAGPKPIYIGFGSIVVDNPTKLTSIIFEAVKNTGQRALISKGWGNIGAGSAIDIPDNILIVGNLPHDWLFQHVLCIVHHGGAGTTAAGLALGCPTVIVSFFGDQRFWGRVVARAEAGPKPIPYKQLTVENLTEALQFALLPSTKEKAQVVGENIQKEWGTRDAVRSFHRHLDSESSRCAICPSRPAAWYIKDTSIGLSAFAATVLVNMGKLNPRAVILYRSKEYDTYRDPRGPVSAGAQIFFGAIANFVTGITSVPTDIVNNVISASHAINHPHVHSDPRSQCGCPGHVTLRADGERAENQEARGLPDEGGSTDANTHENGQRVRDALPESSGEQDRSPLPTPQQTMSSVNSAIGFRGFMSEAALHGKRGLKKFFNVVVWIPTDLTLSMTKGFHNAPKLYHDVTVQPSPKVTGFRSGLRAARTELKDGFYHGITGLVTLPSHGIKSDGGKGLAKGVGKGIGGAILKPTAGLWGLAGYPLSGLRRKLLKSLGKDVEGRIIQARIAQGCEELQASSTEEKAEVVDKWALIEAELRKT